MVFDRGKKYTLYGWQINDAFEYLWSYVQKYPHGDDRKPIPPTARSYIQDQISEQWVDLLKYAEQNSPAPCEDEDEDEEE